jgi:hypothetical protein
VVVTVVEKQFYARFQKASRNDGKFLHSTFSVLLEYNISFRTGMVEEAMDAVKGRLNIVPADECRIGSTQRQMGTACILLPGEPKQ